MFEIKPWENQNLEVNFFELTRKKLTSIKFLAYRAPLFFPDLWPGFWPDLLGQQIHCAVRLGRRNTVYSTARTEKTNYLRSKFNTR